MEDTIENLKIKHHETYKKAILESINNNTNVLVDEDITSLLKKPPLDSMDAVKLKFLALAKKNKIILDTESLSNILDDYRNNLLKCVKKLKKSRCDDLSLIVNSYKDTEIIKLLKKDFNDINKKLRNIFKEQYIKSTDRVINDINKIFVENTDEEIKIKIIEDVKKFITNTYLKQLQENIDIKILVKDTTLINLVKEQTERYLFTLENSRLFKDNI